MTHTLNGANGDKVVTKVVHYWPVIMTALALTVTAATANSRIENLDKKVEYIYSSGSPTTQERLVRIETQQNELAKTLDRVEDKLDQDLTVSPSSRKRLNRL